MDDISELIYTLLGSIAVGALIGVGARAGLPGDQRLDWIRTILYGMAGGVIGAGAALLLDLDYRFAIGIGALVSMALIVMVHQHGHVDPGEDADGIAPDPHHDHVE